MCDSGEVCVCVGVKCHVFCIWSIWTDVCVLCMSMCVTKLQVRLLAAPESMPNKQLLVERKVACAQNAGKGLDDGGLHIPTNHL